MTQLELSNIGLWGLFLVLGWHVLRLRQTAHSSIGVPLMGFDLGTPWPSLEVKALDGSPLRIGHGRTTCIVFLSTHCPTCRNLMPDLAPMLARHTQLQWAFLIAGEHQQVKAMAEAAGLALDVVAAISMEVMRERFHITMYPFAYLMTSDGHVGGKTPVARIANIDALLHSWRRSSSQRPAFRGDESHGANG